MKLAISGKGGVGKTTLCSAAGAGLCRRGARRAGGRYRPVAMSGRGVGLSRSTCVRRLHPICRDGRTDRGAHGREAGHDRRILHPQPARG